MQDKNYFSYKMVRVSFAGIKSVQLLKKTNENYTNSMQMWLLHVVTSEREDLSPNFVAN